jgi:hypothetical protein
MYTFFATQTTGLSAMTINATKMAITSGTHSLALPLVKNMRSNMA